MGRGIQRVHKALNSCYCRSFFQEYRIFHSYSSPDLSTKFNDLLKISLFHFHRIPNPPGPLSTLNRFPPVHRTSHPS